MKQLIKGHKLKNKSIKYIKDGSIFNIIEVYSVKIIDFEYITLLTRSTVDGSQNWIDWEMLKEEDSDLCTHQLHHIKDNNKNYEII